MIRQLFFLSIVLCALGLSTAYGQAAAPGGCTAIGCHANILKKKDVHPGAEPCETCHQQGSTPHPAEKGKGKGQASAFTLTEALPKLCYQCHSAFGTKQAVHPPVKNGECTFCHNPHASDEKKLLAKPVKDLCLSCHPDKTEHKFLHPPTEAGECLSCHNPHESANARLLLKDGVDLCLQCHADPRGDSPRKKVIHPALEGGCTSCHNPHGSDAKKFLPAQGAPVCFACHPAIESKVTGSAKSVHPPVRSEKGCVSCHDPHAADVPKLLPKAGKDLCLDCHKDFIKKTDVVLHGPIKDGKCAACHDPHGSPNDKLLVQPYSPEFYVSYNDTEFPLCFSCHNREMLKVPTTSYATGFRDGEKNLHYLHVNRQDRGKRCKACHVVHAGPNPKLIATKVPFGKWNLPLNFEKTENGGSCAPGCHQAYSYDRKNPTKGKMPTKEKAEKKKKKKGKK